MNRTTIFDIHQTNVGYIENNMLWDNNFHILYRLDGNTIWDGNNVVVGKLEGDHIYDTQGRLVYIINENYVLNESHSHVYTLFKNYDDIDYSNEPCKTTTPEKYGIGSLIFLGFIIYILFKMGCFN